MEETQNRKSKQVELNHEAEGAGAGSGQEQTQIQDTKMKGWKRTAHMGSKIIFSIELQSMITTDL
jgi:hypothetical protein